MNLAYVLILITILAYVSNWINWRFLNSRLNQFLYYIGSLVHESSHAIICFLTGAKIQEFRVFSQKPHVTHTKSKIPIVGQALISTAPIAGGLLFLYLLDHYIGSILYGSHTNIDLLSIDQLSDFLVQTVNIFTHIDWLAWQTWIFIMLTLNMGAMLGPSARDLKNMWPAVIASFFIQSPSIISLGLNVIWLILIGIAIQITLVVIIKITKLFR